MKTLKIASLTLSLLLLNACSAINAELKAGPIGNTAFASHALAEVKSGVEAVPAKRYPFHRVWRAAGEALEPRPGSIVFVAPVDTAQLVKSAGGVSMKRGEAVLLGEYLREKLQNELRRKSFQVVEEPPVMGRVIELAIVEASTTDVARNILGTALGAVVPGGGLISIASSGSTAIEGVVRDAGSGNPLFIFADRERGKIAPFSFNDFTEYSHARKAIDEWAEQIVKACSAPLGAEIADSSAVTLLPL